MTQPGVNRWAWGSAFGPFAALVLAVNAAYAGPVGIPAGALRAVGASEKSASEGASTPLSSLTSLLRGEHLARLHVNGWHARGFRGQGLKVAVLDSGFRGFRDQLGQALPDRVTARSFRRDGNLEARDSRHGILCGEVIHSLAPDAELLFANWDADRPEEFLEAVRWARARGARIVSCSLIMPSWSDGEGGGALHRELARLLGPGTGDGDLLFFASAGNTAQRHWAGRFRPGAGGWHEWDPGQVDNVLLPWGKEKVSVELYGPSAASYEVLILDRVTQTEVARSQGFGPADPCGAAARFYPDPGRTYRVRVRATDRQAGRFHLVALGAGLEFSTAKGSVAFPGDGTEVVAVGAATADGERQSYSSCGPAASGPKPEFVAPVPFPSLWRNRPFTGTSAAAPQAAALAAVCWSRHPRWTALQVRTELRRLAHDVGTPGVDAETGFGMIDLEPADRGQERAELPAADSPRR